MTRTVDAGLLLMQVTNREGFELAIRPHFLPSECELIMRAYRLAKYGHKEQMREGGIRYFEHPKALALLLVRLGVRDVPVIIAALLHDVIEDSYILELADIEAWFGADACRTVQLLTKDKKEGLTLAQYFDRLLKGGFRGWLGKLADRLHNMSTLVDGDDPEKREKFRQKKLRQVAETREFILPLATALSAAPGYEVLGQWFFDQLTAWCELREAEALAAAPVVSEAQSA